ncbi:MAG: aspartate carbamoyltransferase [Kiritimatiellae bacterium]|nr:aspartate carbamoyltransferase [Kiritimatiellia bacterium]MBQ3343337.1 aspartate carbamoyltransferase [Kiritimatiellia bacterium]
MARLTDIGWNEFAALSLEAKRPYLARQEGDGMPYHTLFAQQFDRALLVRLCALANRIRFINKSKEGALYLKSVLAHKRAMLYFSQPSSRTFLSHLAACQILGITTGSVRDAATSSEFKGESKEDSIRTFSSYFDMIIMRSPEQGLAEKMAWELSNSSRPIPILNAGSGKDQHPTQALLDIYTLVRSFENKGGLDGRTVVFCGDLLRGRTVRSLSYLLTNFRDVRQVFVAPKELQVPEDVTGILTAKGVSYSVSGNLREAVREADAVYMTRIQDEWDSSKGASARIDTSHFKFGAEELAILKPDGVIMHPLPRRDEIATCCDHDPRAMYWRQMRNGMWIRAALIAATFGFEESVMNCGY